VLDGTLNGCGAMVTEMKMPAMEVKM